MILDTERIRTAVATVTARHPQIELIVLFGSRARGEGRPDSDWDLAYSTRTPLDSLSLHADLVDALQTDDVDAVDLSRASALLRYRVARDGVLLFERAPGTFARFWLSAVDFWCDVAPMVRAAQADLFEALER